MAKLTTFIGQPVIAGFKGVIDFYLHDGVQCARTWPRNRGKAQTPASVAQWPMFTYTTRLWGRTSPVVQESYNALAAGSGLSGKDLQHRAYYGDLYRYPFDRPT